ncbi:MAG TPA: hypothetical protein VME44_27940 [Streptosporangiaceae bacterium]|nr:hypothetical protein [Streptosporangiaceae bacterium]
MTYLAAYLGALAWLLLTIPVLVAGLIRLGRRWPWAEAPAGGWVVGIASAGAWFTGIALMFQIANWHPSAPAVLACNKNQGCALIGYRHAVVSWGELAILAGRLALGAAITLILARSARGRDLPDAGSRFSREASL